MKPRPPDAPEEREHDRQQGDQDRDDPDVQGADPALEGLDVLAQRVLYLAKLGPQVEHLGPEAVDLLLLRRGHHDTRRLLLLLQIADRLLEFPQAGLELLLLGAELFVGRALHPGGHLERSEEHTSELQSLLRISY